MNSLHRVFFFTKKISVNKVKTDSAEFHREKNQKQKHKSYCCSVKTLNQNNHFSEQAF